MMLFSPNFLFAAPEELSAQAIALYVDAMRLNRVADLPTQIYQQVQQSPAVLQRILNIYSQFNEQELTQLAHPFFAIYLPQQRLLFKQSKACERLEYYHEEPTFKSANDKHTDNKTEEEEFVKEEKKFNWSVNLPQKLGLIVVDNAEEELFSATIDNGFVLQLPENDFLNGLYYYKLIDDEENILQIGNFYVFRY